MVSQGEYLNAAAAELTRVETKLQRDLRLYGIASSLRPMVGAGGSPLSNAMGRLAEAARDAIGRGAASHSVDPFVAAIRAAATALVGAQMGDEQQIADRVSAAASELGKLTAAMTTRAMPRVAEEPREAAAREAPAKPVAHDAPAAPAAPVIGGSDLVTSYLTLEQLIAERGMPAGSLDELVLGVPTSVPRTTGPRSVAPMAPARAAAAASPAPATDVVEVASLAPDDAGVVPVESLVYSGPTALRRALELRRELDSVRHDDARLQALLREVFDLVELGLGTTR
jgi:hypothetical protein